METVCLDTADRNTDRGSLAWSHSSWQGWNALGRGAETLPTSCLIWKRPVAGSNTPIHHCPSLRFSREPSSIFAAIFLPLLLAVSQGRLRSNITDTGWCLGSNEWPGWVYQEEQQKSFSASLLFALFFPLIFPSRSLSAFVSTVTTFKTNKVRVAYMEKRQMFWQIQVQHSDCWKKKNDNME